MGADERHVFGFFPLEYHTARVRVGSFTDSMIILNSNQIFIVMIILCGDFPLFYFTTSRSLRIVKALG